MLKKFCTNSQSRPTGAAELRRKSPRRRYGAHDPRSSYYRILAGADRGFGCRPPASEGSSEVRPSRSHHLRRENPNGSWCFPPVSALLDGVGLFGIRPPPASECWPELSADSDAVLRRTRARRRYEFHTLACSGETNPNRNWCLPPVSALLTGVGLFGIRLPPASEC